MKVPSSSAVSALDEVEDSVTVWASSPGADAVRTVLEGAGAWMIAADKAFDPDVELDRRWTSAKEYPKLRFEILEKETR